MVFHIEIQQIHQQNAHNFQLHGAPFVTNSMEFTTDLEPDIVGCDRFEQFVKLVSGDAGAYRIEMKFYA